MKELVHGTWQATNKLLVACFFILGMGLFAPVASIWQSMDYLNAMYEEYYPSRLLSTGYNMMYVILVFIMYLYGGKVWPNKHSRLLTGYLLYVGALALPPLVDQVLLNYLGLCGSKAALQGALACWAVAAAIAGASDAVLSSVIYAEAGAAGATYTHAFMAGKAACGLVMASLRCVSKAAMPATRTGLQHSTGIYSAAAAALVLVCVAIVAWVLPGMRSVLESLREHSGLTVEQTLHEIDMAVAKAHATHLHNTHTHPAHKRSLATCSSCATMSAAGRTSGVDACSDKQLASLSYPPHTPKHPATHRFAVPFPEALFLHGAQYSLPELMQSALAHCRGQQTGYVELLPSCPSGALSSNGSWVLHIPADAGSDAVLIHALAESSRASSRSAVSLGSRRGSCESMYGFDLGIGSGSTVGHLQKQGSGVSSQEGTPAAAATDLHLPAAGCLTKQVQVEPLQQQRGCSASSLACYKPGAAAKTAGCQVLDKTAPPLATRSIFASSAGGAPSSWMAMKLIYPYQIAAFIPPLITAAVMPLCMSSQVGQSRALGSWYIQVLVVAVQLGGFCGSALIPVVNPKYPRATLLTAACSMFLFIGAFAVALKKGLFALGFIPLSFVMQMCAGYLTTCVFCLAPQGLLTADAEMVQQLLVLTTAVSFAGGTSISWAWLAAGKTRCP